MSATGGCFASTALLVTSDFMLKGSQSDHPNFCRVDQQVVSTEADANFEHVRQLLTEHLRVVTSAGYRGPDTARWPKAAAVGPKSVGAEFLFVLCFLLLFPVFFPGSIYVLRGGSF